MKKYIFLLLLSVTGFSQQTNFPYGIKNPAATVEVSPTMLTTHGATNIYGKVSVNNLPVSTAALDSLANKANLTDVIQNQFTTTQDGSFKISGSGALGDLNVNGVTVFDPTMTIRWNKPAIYDNLLSINGAGYFTGAGTITSFKPEVPVYIIVGESNAAGIVPIAEASPSDLLVQDNVFILNNTTMLLEKLHVGVNGNIGLNAATNLFGFEVPILENNPIGQDAYIVKTAWSGADVQYLISDIATAYARIDATFEQIKATGRVPVPYIIYSQGINNIGNTSDVNWRILTVEYITALREHIGFAPVFITELMTGYTDFNATIETLGEHVGWVYPIDATGATTGTMGANHWDKAGFVTLYDRILDEIATIGELKNFPIVQGDKLSIDPTLLHIDDASYPPTANSLVQRNAIGYTKLDYTEFENAAENPTISELMVFGGDNYGRKISLSNAVSQLGTFVPDPNTLVLRNVNGYARLSYTEFTNPPETSPTITDFMIFTGDNYGRKATIADVKTSLFASPTLTGTPTAPTAAVGTNTTQIATTAFVNAQNAIVPLDEGNGIGYIIKGRNSANYGNIGNGATDLNYNGSASSTVGATGIYSFTSGEQNTANQTRSGVFGGGINVASSDNAVIVGGYGNSNSGSSAGMLGGTYSQALGAQSATIGGNSVFAKSTTEVAMGSYPTDYTVTNTSTDRALVVGNGVFATPSNALVLLKNGTIITSNVIRLKNYTVATLPAGTQGDTAYVTDATAPTYLGTLTGGGAVVCPVFYNGANWVAH